MSAPTIRPIATTLRRRIFVWAAACSLLFMAMQAAYSYRHLKAQFQAEVSEVAVANVPLLAINLWDIEPEAVLRQIDNIAARPHIGYVRLTAVTGQYFSAGNEGLLRSAVVKRFDVHPPNSSEAPLATLEICENPDAFFQELAVTVGIASLGYFALTLLICGLVMYVLKRRLERPMRRIARFVTALTPQSLTTPLVLGRPIDHPRDEIDLVVDGFQVLQTALNDHIRNLDQLVVQRTQELQTALGSIERLSLIDPLTQCLNRRAFDAQIEVEIERAQRYKHPLSLVFGDIDHFKRINDSLGHLVGDQVLQAVAQSLRDGLRTDVDWIARFGGEEFVILMPETDLAGAVICTERLRMAIEHAQLLPEHPAFRTTISFGVAAYVAGESVQTFVHRADGLLYQAKHAGRNQTWPRASGAPSQPASLASS